MSDYKRHLRHIYTYHPPSKAAIPKFTKIREAALELALLLAELCPDSFELETAQLKLEEVVMHANAAIARNECSVMRDTDANDVPVIFET